MAVNQQPQLLECGHVGRFSGGCQYEAHGIRLCQDCVITCDRCGRTLCQQHQRWTTWTEETRVFCPDHILSFYLQRFLARFFWGGDTR